MELRQREPRVKDPLFLQWAHSQPGQCCLCLTAAWQQLHHFGGEGSRGDDEWVCRICSQCHHPPDPARKRGAMIRDEDWETYARMLEDSMHLMVGYKRTLVDANRRILPARCIGCDYLDEETDCCAATRPHYERPAAPRGDDNAPDR